MDDSTDFARQDEMEWKCIAVALKKSRQILEIYGLDLAIEYILLIFHFI